MLSDNAQTMRKTHSGSSVFLTLVPALCLLPVSRFLSVPHCPLLSLSFSLYQPILLEKSLQHKNISDAAILSSISHVICMLYFPWLFLSGLRLLDFLAFSLDASCLSCFVLSSLCSPICSHRKVNMFLRLL